MIIIKYYLYVVILGLFLIGCSGAEKVVNATNRSVQDDSGVNPKQKAIDHFLNGSVAEQEGNYTDAISEYQKALKYDSSGGIYYSLAKSYFAVNKLSKALQYSRISVEKEADEIEYYNLMSDIFIVAHENDSAAVVLEKMISMDSTEVSYYYKLARVYENTKPSEAIRIYEKLITLIGPEWNILIRVAELYEKLGSKEEAAKSLDKLLALDPSNVALQKMIIDFNQRNGNYDKALDMVDNILELYPDDLEAREKKALILIQQGKWEEASEQYKFLLKDDSIPLESKIDIGASFFAKSVTDSTVLPFAKNIFKTIDSDTTDWQVKLYLGAIALAEGDDSTAVKDFKFVTENARYNAQAWVRLGGLYFDNHKYDEAEKLMNEAVGLFPNDFAVNLILGLSLAQSGKPGDAEPYLAKAVQLNHSDLTALSAYAFALSQLGKDDVAVEYLKDALNLKPDDVNLLGQLGLSYNNLGNLAESDSVYEKVLVIDPHNALVNNNYAYSLSERGLQLERALNMVNIALENDSLNSSYLDTKGWIYFKLKEYKPAQEFIEKAIKIGGENAVMLEHLGDILYMSGDKAQAVENWKKALKLDENNENLIRKVDEGVI